jgi:hypothetical protein
MKSWTTVLLFGWNLHWYSPVIFSVTIVNRTLHQIISYMIFSIMWFLCNFRILIYLHCLEWDKWFLYSNFVISSVIHITVINLCMAYIILYPPYLINSAIMPSSLGALSFFVFLDTLFYSLTCQNFYLFIFSYYPSFFLIIYITLPSFLFFFIG